MLTSSIDVLWTARYDYRCNWKLVPHKHDYFQMIYFLSGSGRLLLGDTEYRIQPGDLFLIKPQRIHGLAPHSPVKTLDLKFVVNDNVLRESLLEATERITQSDSTIAAHFEHIRREGERKDYLYRESCKLFLLQVLVQYLRQDKHSAATQAAELNQAADLSSEDEIPDDSVVRKALEFIRNHYAEDLELPQIAESVQRSDRHLRQHFEDCLGVPPMRYLQQYRLRKAKELIQYSDYPLKEIAELVGFKTIHHFTRIFHELLGESPGAWRRKYQAGICKDVCIEPQFSNVNWTFPENFSPAVEPAEPDHASVEV
jgi:AraC-like DNA-binding protein